MNWTGLFGDSVCDPREPEPVMRCARDDSMGTGGCVAHKWRTGK